MAGELNCETLFDAAAKRLREVLFRIGDRETNGILNPRLKEEKPCRKDCKCTNAKCAATSLR
jgi:hypothetical protein